MQRGGISVGGPPSRPRVLGAAGYPVTCQSLTGYSEGGRRQIEAYESGLAPNATVLYALGLQHKHLPEMQMYAGLAEPPLFTPMVGPHAQGLVVTIPLLARHLARQTSAVAVRALFSTYYAGRPFVRVVATDDDDAVTLEPTGCNGTNRADLFVVGHGL